MGGGQAGIQSQGRDGKKRFATYTASPPVLFLSSHQSALYTASSVHCTHLGPHVHWRAESSYRGVCVACSVIVLYAVRPSGAQVCVTSASTSQLTLPKKKQAKDLASRGSRQESHGGFFLPPPSSTVAPSLSQETALSPVLIWLAALVEKNVADGQAWLGRHTRNTEHACRAVMLNKMQGHLS